MIAQRQQSLLWVSAGEVGEAAVTRLPSPSSSPRTRVAKWNLLAVQVACVRLNGTFWRFGGAFART